MEINKTKPKSFIFDSYRLDKHSGRIDFFYAFDNGLRFKESISLPAKKLNRPGIDNKILDKVLFNLHLVIGIGYYKAYCPRKIIIKSGRLNREQAAFWNKLYTKGLGEFFYKNKLDYRGLINFPFSHFSEKPIKKVFKDRCLSPIGGGKDSCLAAEKLMAVGKEITLISLRDSSIQKETAALIGRPQIVVNREIDPLLFELNRQGAYNGHIPISAIYSWITILMAVIDDYRYIVFANEASANYGNVKYLGEEINHQYSKSFEFEQDLAAYLKNNICPGLEYFSILRPFSELKIASQFTRYEKYLPAFSSCNRNFKINNPASTRWCGECPKCAFTYTLLSAFKTKAELKKIFSRNLFADKKMLPLFQELWGEKRIKPFDCVGTPEEVKAAMLLAAAEGSYKQDMAMKYFLAKIAPKIKDKEKLIDDAFALNPLHAVPADFRQTVILGWGEEGKYLFSHYRREHPKMKLWIADKKELTGAGDKNTTLIDGPDYLHGLESFDVIAKSPGLPASLPEIKTALNRGVELTSASRIFFQKKYRQVIGITGTKGKSTTSSLICAILKAAKKDAYLVGNIGADPLRLLNANDKAIFVYELSSYQLSTLEYSPHIAVYVSLFPDHLPYHQGFENYTAAKANISLHQNNSDVFIYNGEFPAIKKLATKTKARTENYAERLSIKNNYLFYDGDKILPLAAIQLPGKHNLKNIAAAIAVARTLKINKTAIAQGIASFRGLEHRLQAVGQYRGITFYDDAISTTPESTMAALDYLGDKTACILLGGEDRGYDFSILASTLKKLPLTAIVLFPDSGLNILKALKKAYGSTPLPPLLQTKSMEAAVKFAYAHTPAGRACLLSTASPSYSIFKNYKDKGDQFRAFAKQHRQ